MPTVYRSTDEGAPVLYYTQDSLNDLLYTVLVTGYGSKQAAGWTREFRDDVNDVSVYRNSPTDGTGTYLRVAFDSNGNSRVRAYETMTGTGEDEGTNPTPPLSEAAMLVYYNRSGAIPWLIIADNRGFWIFIVQGSNGYYDGFRYFGDFISCVPGDTYNFILLGDEISQPFYYLQYNAPYQPWLLRDRNGDSNCETNTIITAILNNNNYFGDRARNCPYPFNNGVWKVKPWYGEGGSQNNDYPRGKIPGLTDFLHDGDSLASAIGINWSGDTLDDATAQATIEGVNYIIARHYYGLVAIDLDHYWEF